MRISWLLAIGLILTITSIQCAVTRYVAPATMTVHVIDSLVRSIDDNEQLVETFRTGTVGNTGKLKTYFLKDTFTNQLYRVRYVESLDTADNTAYYYYQGKLVFADVRRVDQTTDTRKIIYNCLYYFRNDSILAAIDEDLTYSNPKEVLKLGNIFYHRTNTKPLKRKS